MCIVFLAHHATPAFALILAANRDEFYARPTQSLHWWQDHSIAGGMDLKQGGTWLACDHNGRWGAITNYRDPSEFARNARSRGHLIPDFLQSGKSPHDFIQSIDEEASQFNGFNLLLGDRFSLYCYTNRIEAGASFEKIQPGVHGLSNKFLNTPWPKVVSGKARMQSIVDQTPENTAAYFDMLHDETKAKPSQLPDTGIGLEKEFMLSSRFIRSPIYGTRSMTLLMIKNDGNIQIQERSFGPNGKQEKRDLIIQFQINNQNT